MEGDGGAGGGEEWQGSHLTTTHPLSLRGQTRVQIYINIWRMCNQIYTRFTNISGFCYAGKPDVLVEVAIIRRRNHNDSI